MSTAWLTIWLSRWVGTRWICWSTPGPRCPPRAASCRPATPPRTAPCPPSGSPTTASATLAQIKIIPVQYYIYRRIFLTSVASPSTEHPTILLGPSQLTPAAWFQGLMGHIVSIRIYFLFWSLQKGREMNKNCEQTMKIEFSDKSNKSSIFLLWVCVAYVCVCFCVYVGMCVCLCARGECIDIVK